MVVRQASKPPAKVKSSTCHSDGSAKKARHARQTQAARARASTGNASMVTRNAGSGSASKDRISTAESDVMLLLRSAAARTA
jgi:hypothetical protein